MDNEEIKRPVYKFVDEEGASEVEPNKRKIAKIMEVTETFTYFDALKYCMKLEKSKEDKLAEIAGLDAMIDAYKKELAIIDSELDIVHGDEVFNQELHEKLKKEKEDAENDVSLPEEDGSIVSPYAEENN